MFMNDPTGPIINLTSLTPLLLPYSSLSLGPIPHAMMYVCSSYLARPFVSLVLLFLIPSPISVVHLFISSSISTSPTTNYPYDHDDHDDHVPVMYKVFFLTKIISLLYKRRKMFGAHIMK